MSENPKISMLTHEFLDATQKNLGKLEKILGRMRMKEGDASLSVHSPERQIEHLVGGFMSAVAGVKDLEAYGGGKESRLSFIKESLELYLEQRFEEKTILAAVNDGTIKVYDNPIPAMRRMQRILKDNFDL